MPVHYSNLFHLFLLSCLATLDGHVIVNMYPIYGWSFAMLEPPLPTGTLPTEGRGHLRPSRGWHRDILALYCACQTPYRCHFVLKWTFDHPLPNIPFPNVFLILFLNQMLDSNNGKARFDDHLNFTVCSITGFLPMVLMGIVPSSLKTSSGSNRFTATNPLLFCSILAISLLPTGILTSLQSNISCFSLKIAHSVRIRFFHRFWKHDTQYSIWSACCPHFGYWCSSFCSQ